MWRWAGLLACLWGFYGAAQAADETPTHFRVVLDLSKSMRVDLQNGGEGNDPGGMAILSTLLLYDLADLDYGLPTNSFKVIPFHGRYKWPDANTPPTTNGTIIVAKADRSIFAARLNKLQYEAECTHFFPGISEAANDLKATGNPDDNRTIVVVTDGLPDDAKCKPSTPETRATEKNLIETQLLPVLRSNKIRLYVLAFGRNVREDFFATMTIDTGGRVFLAKGGEDLLESMLRVFAESMGYKVEGPYPLPASTLNLAETPKTAIVAFNPKGASPAEKPDIKLDTRLNIGYYQHELAPVIPNVGNSHPGDPGAGYALAWVKEPRPGSYTFAVKPSRGQWALVRKPSAKLNLVDLKNPSSGSLATNVMALQDLPFGIDANILENAVVSYRLYAPDAGMTRENTDGAKAPAGTSKVHTFGDNSQFKENTKNPSKPYKGEIYAQATLGGINGKKIADLHPNPYEVTVWPYLSIRSIKPSENAGPSLKKGEFSCVDFRLEKTGNSHMPAPRSGRRYAVVASIDIADPKTVNQEFHNTTFTLEQASKSITKSIDFTGRSSEWAKGVELTEDELLGNYTFCVKLGEPKLADPTNTLELPVHFVLKQAPYDTPEVIERFIYRLTLEKVEPPDPQPTLPLWLTAALLFLLWHRRGQPKLPPDLAFALAPDGADAKPTPRRLGEGSSLRRALGLVVERSIIPASGEEALAWVRPVEGELYRLRLGKGVALEDPASGLPLPTLNGFAEVAVRRPYRLRRGSRAYRVWLEYRA